MNILKLFLYDWVQSNFGSSLNRGVPAVKDVDDHVLFDKLLIVVNILLQVSLERGKRDAFGEKIRGVIRFCGSVK